MALPLALASILGGLGLGAQNMQQQHQQAQEMERQKKRDALAERQVALAEQQAYEDPSAYAPLFKALGLPDPSANIAGPQKMRAGTTMAMLPMLAAEAKEKRALAREGAERQGIAAVTREAAGTPPTPAEVAPDVPVADGMSTLMNILMPGKAPLPMGEVRARLAQFGKEGRETFREMYPADGFTGVPLDQDLINKNTGEVLRRGTPKPHEPKMMNAANIIDALTVEYQSLIGSGVSPEDPRAKNLAQRINNQKLIAQQEGGSVVGPMGVVREGQPKTQGLPGGQAEGLADMRSMIAQLNEVERVYKPEYSGPVAGRVGAVRQATGVGLGKDEAEMRALVQGFNNQLLRLRSGAAVTPSEYERIKSELPQVTDPPAAFGAKLNVARRLMEQALANREAEFGRRGFRSGDAPAAPGDQPRVRVPDSATQAPVQRWGRDAQGRPVPIK